MINGPDSVPGGAEVTLDGSASSDPEGRALTYHWTQIAGPPVTLDDVQSPMLHFQAPQVAVDTTESIEFMLVVTDDFGATGADERSIDVIGPAPLGVEAGATPDVLVPGGTTSLSAVASGGYPPYSYNWTELNPGKLPGSFADPHAQATTWTAPSAPVGEVGIRVDVVDSQGNASFAITVVEVKPDCNTNGVADPQDIASGQSRDCDENGTPDECDLAAGDLHDCQTNGTPDECEAFADCNSNGKPDVCDIDAGRSGDCNTNGIPDECDIASGSLHDCEPNGIPNECEPGWTGDCNTNICPPLTDCNTNLVDDFCDVVLGSSPDCNENFVPDECDLAQGTSHDCNTNLAPDECDLGGGVSPDCNLNGAPDECDVADGTSPDCNTNGVPDECDLIGDGGSPDCNDNGVPDECELAEFDCNTNGVPDRCDIYVYGTSGDCNENNQPDECDIANGLPDANHDGIPDECQGPLFCAFCQGDMNMDAVVDGDDIAGFFGCMESSGGCGCSDLNNNGIPANMDSEDLAMFVEKLLSGEGTSCPPP